MQAVFILSLFSLIFIMFASISAGLSRNIMQSNIERVAEVRSLFSEVETAITKMAFKEKTETGTSIVDLSDVSMVTPSGSFLAEHISYPKKRIEKDPWQDKIHIITTTKREPIWGGSGGQIAEAPITTFLIVSAGPNRIYDLFNSLGTDPESPVLSDSDIETIDISDKNIVGDDIITRFNNYDAMLDVWEKSENLDMTVKNIALDYYKNAFNAFSPLIQLAQRDINRDGALNTSVFSDLSANDGYDAFSNLENESDKSLTNEWYTANSDPGSIYSALIKYRTAKKYGEDGSEEFTLSSDPTYSKDLNDAFKNEYSGVEFLYPSFDAVERDAAGTPLPNSSRGLQNLGVSNIDTLDPFFGVDGELDYSYDPNDPARLYITRTANPADEKKWKITKKFEIDGLGGL